jgi:hypothetical protein
MTIPQPDPLFHPHSNSQIHVTGKACSNAKSVYHNKRLTSLSCSRGHLLCICRQNPPCHTRCRIPPLIHHHHQYPNQQEHPSVISVSASTSSLGSSDSAFASSPFHHPLAQPPPPFRPFKYVLYHPSCHRRPPIAYISPSQHPRRHTRQRLGQ